MSAAMRAFAGIGDAKRIAENSDSATREAIAQRMLEVAAELFEFETSPIRDKEKDDV